MNRQLSRILAFGVLPLGFQSRSYPQDNSNDSLVVRFKQSTRVSEALGVLRSYGRSFEFHPQSTRRLTLFSEEQRPLAEAVNVVTDVLERNKGAEGKWSVQRLPDQKTIIFRPENISIPPEILGLLRRRLPSNVSLHVEERASYAIEAYAEGSTFPELISKESAVDSTFAGTAPQSSGYEPSVESSTTVHTESGNAPFDAHRPSRALVMAKSLPKLEIVERLLGEAYRNARARVVLEKEETERDGEYFQFSVSNIRGTITVPPYWERLVYRIPIYRLNDKQIQIRCFLDGRFAPGMGEKEPSPEAYNSMEPRFTNELQSKADILVTQIR